MTLLQRTAYNPWREFDRLFGFGEIRSTWKPAFDIAETDSAYVLRGDLPGVKQDDIEVRVDDNSLTLRAERVFPEAEGEHAFRRIERPGGSFARTFVVPRNVNHDEVKASFENGVIELVLPKQEPVDSSRLIPVS